MWIIPTDCQAFSHYAQDTVASKEDLSSPDLSIESSLMSRSKPTPLPTWLRRWNKGGWFRHLSGRILKPCQWTAFEIALSSSLAVIPANRSAQQESAPEKMTPATSGLGSENISKQSDLFGASLKTSRDTSASDCKKSSKTWKALVTQRRGEYLARLKSARHIRESESISWPAAEIGTPTASMTVRSKEFRKGRIPSPAEFVQMWPTPTANSRDATPRWTKTRNGKQLVEPNLAGAVQTWPTPSARDHKGGYIGGRIRNGKVSFDTLDVAVQYVSNKDKKSGTLNPNWVEWLMGVPTGWTDLGSWGTA